MPEVSPHAASLSGCGALDRSGAAELADPGRDECVGEGGVHSVLLEVRFTDERQDELRRRLSHRQFGAGLRTPPLSWMSPTPYPYASADVATEDPVRQRAEAAPGGLCPHRRADRPPLD